MKLIATWIADVLQNDGNITVVVTKAADGKPAVVTTHASRPDVYPHSPLVDAVIVASGGETRHDVGQLVEACRDDYERDFLFRLRARAGQVWMCHGEWIDVNQSCSCGRGYHS
jgi:hypothetical protein